MTTKTCESVASPRSLTSAWARESPRAWRRAWLLVAIGYTGAWIGVSTSVAAQTIVPFTVSGDAIAAPLSGLTGDAARGRAIVKDRTSGNCLICHAAPEPDERFMGDIAPALNGVGSRLSAGQIRLRLVDQSRINPATVMPPYYRVDGLTRVAPRFAGQPALSAQQIEDVVAYLATLAQ